MRRSEAGIEPLRLHLDPKSIDAYEYPEMDWCRLARAGERRVAYGPFVGSSGSDQFAVAMRSPIEHQAMLIRILVDTLLPSLLRRTATTRPGCLVMLGWGICGTLIVVAILAARVNWRPSTSFETRGAIKKEERVQGVDLPSS